jgi:hypothetical protein
MSICSFTANLLILAAKVKAENIFIHLLVKTIALFGVITPILYWLKLLNTINI